MVGYFSPQSTTQHFNCHKLSLFEVGFPTQSDL